MQTVERRKMDSVLLAFRKIRQKSHLGLADFARAVVEQLKFICDYSGCAILLVEGGLARTIAHEGITGHDMGIDIRIDMATLGALREHQEGLQKSEDNAQDLYGFIPAGRDAKSLICAPIMQSESVAGIIYVDSRTENAFDKEDLYCVDLMAEELSLAIQRSLIEARVGELSKMDALMGCFNRGALEEDLKTEIARSRRYEKKFSLFSLDIDRVATEENCPDKEKEQVLKTWLVRILRRNIRNIDRTYFYEDNKFVVLLPETDKIETITVVSRLIEVLRQTTFQDQSGLIPSRKVTISVGISGYPDDGNSISELLNSAEASLVQARTRGGNRLCVCGEGMAKVEA
jgi:diguanylate cyclase (GGDEF)-like protein